MLKKRAPKRVPVHGVALENSGFALRWTTCPDPAWVNNGLSFPAGRTFAWDAEPVGIHYWCDYPHEESRRLRGWFAGDRVSTLALGSNYLHSASRWLADPLDSPEQLAAFGEQLQEGCLSLGIGLKGSPGSAAVAVWKSYSRGVPAVPTELNAYCEEAIYAGRTELIRATETHGITQWDRSSAYPSHLAEPLPAPGSERQVDEVDLESDGITEAIVTAKPGACPHPVLPCKVTLASGETRTCFPWGRFWGRWTNVELLAAAERGYEIRTRGGVQFSRLDRCHALARFADRLWRARPSFPLVKRLGVSFIGKLHQRRSERVVQPFGPFSTACVKRKRKHFTAGPGYCPMCTSARGKAAAIRLPAGSIFVRRAAVAIVQRTHQKFAPYVNMATAAYVLARARLELLKLMEANQGRVLAVATDGALLWTDKPKGVTIGKGYGEWRREFGPASGRVVAATAYALEDAAGNRKIRTAGILRSKAEQFLAREPVTWEARAGLFQAAKVGQPVTRRAQVSPEIVDREGWTRPPVVRCARVGRVFINREE